MVVRFCFAAMSAALVVLASSVSADAAVSYVHRNEATVAGHKIQIDTADEVNIDCSLMAVPSIKLVVAPQHGRVSVARAKIFPHFAAPNPRTRCDARRVEGIVTSYAPDKNFVGHDWLEIDIAFSTGALTDIKFDIDVK